MEYERYKSLRRLNSNFPPTQQRTMEYKSQRRPNSIFPPTQQRTMEYERYKSLRRPNSSCPPRLSVLFKTKLQVFLKKIAKHQEDPSIWKLFDYMESCCTLEEKNTLAGNVPVKFWEECVTKRKPPLISTNYPLKPFFYVEIWERLAETHVIRTWGTFCVKGESGRACWKKESGNWSRNSRKSAAWRVIAPLQLCGRF